MVVETGILFQHPLDRGREKDLIHVTEIRGPCIDLVGEPHKNLEVGERTSSD